MMLRSGGTKCRCCGQHAQAYRRVLYWPMAKFVCWLTSFPENTWVDVTNSRKIGLGFTGGDYAKAGLWGLVECQSFEDGVKWRATQVGRAFARNLATVPRYVWVYNDAPLGAPEGTLIDVEAASRGKFDWRAITGSL